MPIFKGYQACQKTNSIALLKAIMSEAPSLFLSLTQFTSLALILPCPNPTCTDAHDTVSR